MDNNYLMDTVGDADKIDEAGDYIIIKIGLVGDGNNRINIGGKGLV